MARVSVSATITVVEQDTRPPPPTEERNESSGKPEDWKTSSTGIKEKVELSDGVEEAAQPPPISLPHLYLVLNGLVLTWMTVSFIVIDKTTHYGQEHSFHTNPMSL
ncbi:hypothetical protein AOQ84DRAFT_437028 [Glonium stellatum]|uniref:Uncharacterized protein n=1 Tax=Glonium stellatum TaxID=574774 RepID=A0A8E2F8A6_9PEZI|nr:hypothetical protein AOQ84DRAFT_437028 [Glonium stellatum]